MPEITFVPFHTARLETPYTFLYPAGWQAREIATDGGAEIFIAGPSDPAGTYAVSFTVRMSRGARETPDVAAMALLARYRSAPGFRELGQARGVVAGSRAVEVGISYLAPLPLNNINARPTPITERHVFLVQRDQFFELLYAATGAEYPTWLPAFQTLIQTFTFETQVEHVAFLPLIAIPTPQYAREEAVEYETKRDESDEQPG
ncbi:MAG: hypothetical protein FJ009_04825 [Chloroflexi bacterium]|nr:hypothetical protein [Chloroflexota bacterium]